MIEYLCKSNVLTLNQKYLLKISIRRIWKFVIYIYPSRSKRNYTKLFKRRPCNIVIVYHLLNIIYYNLYIIYYTYYKLYILYIVWKGHEPASIGLKVEDVDTTTACQSNRPCESYILCLYYVICYQSHPCRCIHPVSVDVVFA